MSRIFISHSSKDNFEAVALRDWLAAQGWNDVFLDLDPERGIAAGERWERALHEAANRCEAVIFLISANWLASGWCLKEYALARGLNKKLFAALADPGKTISDLPPELAGTWQVVDLTGGQEPEILRVQPPGSHEEKHVTFSAEGLRRLRKGLEKAGLDPRFFAWPPENEKDRAPYRGLKPLEGADAGIFFGRDAPIVEAADRLRGLCAATAPRLLVILGASGAGKSSFLRAGLLPRLARDDGNFLPLPAIRPEQAALFGENGLLGALEKILPSRTRAELREAIRAGSSGLRPLLADLANAAFQRTLTDAASATPPAIVIAIDQAEELFRPEGAEEGAALLSMLRDLAMEDTPPVIVVFAIRSDSYDDLERAKPLEALAQQTLPLLPMPRGAYKEVIEGPARRLNEAGGRLSIEPRLTESLLADIEKGGGKDALPLLAFTLEQLYREYGRAGGLRLADYESFGGIEGAIGKAVERVFKAADADPRIPREREARLALLRRGLIPWLAGIDPDSKSPRRNIARRADIPEEARPLIDLLVEERLLSTDVAEDTGVATIEPAHEALLRQWGLLKGWLAEDFSRLATLEGVKRGARDWDANARAPAWLAHQGERLAEAQALDERPDIAARLDAADRAYLAQCRAREEAERAAAAERAREREEEQARRLADAQALAEANRTTARRTRIGLFVALILAVVAGGIGFEAWQQKRFADKQRGRAEKTLATATAAANTLIFDLARNLKDVVGVPVSLVKNILDRATKLQDDLTSAGETSPALRRSQLAALNETAGTLLRVGDTQGALAAAQKSLAIARDLAKKKTNAEAQRDLSVSLITIGDVKLRAGDAAGALVAYEEMFNIDRARAKDKTNADAQRDLSVSLDRIADVKLRAGDATGALAAYEESLAIRRDLAKDKSNAEAQRDLAISLGKIGDAKLLAGDAAGALAAYEETLNIDRARAKDKSNAGAQRDLSFSLGRIGVMKLRAGDAAGALAAYEESLAIARELAKDKSNAGAQRDLSVILNIIGDVKLRAGDAAGALATYEESLAIARDLAKDKSNAGAQRDLSISLNRIGAMKLRAGDAAGALAAYEESLAIARDLAKDKSNAGAQSDLSIILNIIGDVKLRTGDAAGALAAYEESLAIARDLAKDKSNAEAQRDLAVSLDNIGDMKLRAGDAAGALAAYEESLAIARELAKDKTNAEAQRDLALSLNRIGDVKLRAGDAAGAHAAYAESLAIRRVLANDKSNAGAQRDLSIGDEKVSDALKKLGKLEDALTYDEASLAIAERLAKLNEGSEDAKSDLVEAAGSMGGLAFDLLLAKKFEKSLEASDRAIAAEPGLVWLATNRAHALMFLGRVKEARTLYLAHRGEKTIDDKIWEDDIREDFAALRKAGLTNPLMDEIARTFAKKH